MVWLTQAEAPPKGNRRAFHTLPMTLAQSFETLQTAVVLKPLNIRPLIDPIPHHWKMNEHYLFHQGPGHNTNMCMALRHRIQDLIEDGTIPTPAGPNVGTNPLPNHPPAAGINALITDDEGPDPVHLIANAPGPQSPSA